MRLVLTLCLLTCSLACEWKKAIAPETWPTWVASVIGVMVLIVYWLTLAAIKHSNRISRKNLEQVQRAFVFSKETNVTGVQDEAGRITKWIFRTTWENSGTTPTRELEIFTGAIWKPDELPKGHIFPSRPDEHISIVLGPKAIIWSKDISITVDILQQVQKGTLHLYFFGTASYRDVFEDTPRHVTKFCVKIFVIGDPIKPTFKPGMASHFEHNCADQDC